MRDVDVIKIKVYQIISVLMLKNYSSMEGKEKWLERSKYTNYGYDGTLPLFFYEFLVYSRSFKRNILTKFDEQSEN